MLEKLISRSCDKRLPFVLCFFLYIYIFVCCISQEGRKGFCMLWKILLQNGVLQRNKGREVGDRV